MDLLRPALEFYQWIDDRSDKRTENWFLVKSPLPIVGFSLSYLAFVLWIGPNMMKHRQPLQFKPVLVVYNLAMSLLNLHIFYELVMGAIEAGYTFPCAPFKMTNDAPEIRLATAMWLHHLSKIVELLDTVFLVLRKKKDQVSFLHVYHHSTVLLVWWAGIKWSAGGLYIFNGSINAFIHIIMYFYYGVSAMGPQFQKYLWWKKYLTQLQLIQFAIILGMSVYGWYTECPFITGLYYLMMGYMTSFLVLFGNFYIQSYIKGRRLPKTKKEATHSMNGVANGKPSNGNLHTKFE